MNETRTKNEIIQQMESDLSVMQQMAAGDEIFDTGLVWPRDDQEARKIRYVKDSLACIEDAKTMPEETLQGIAAGGKCLLMDDNFYF